MVSKRCSWICSKTVAANSFGGLCCGHFEACLCNNRLKRTSCCFTAHSILRAIFGIVCSFFWRIYVCLDSFIRYQVFRVGATLKINLCYELYSSQKHTQHLTYEDSQVCVLAHEKRHFKVSTIKALADFTSSRINSSDKIV
uniref:Uncharacterized protein n=1 Tax=Glossina pallidipes TaxID=7398 RepID=A0A1A9ZBA7_GLOPL